ncbi:hypothetical protein BDZ89DRAFT_559487 [Hymenopellis radicata]|nr:hypothetical protein BDZ89DRAFT_559487 [Hymenopellis radicata]
MAVNGLRDALLEGLKELHGTREFHVHVLASSPRKHNGLFPFAIPKQRAYLQDILVLLSEQKTPDSPRIIVSGIEASVYNIPTTACAVLYVSKVDGTGQSSAPSPTSTLVRSFLLYYADPVTRPLDAEHFWIQLFARAQNQYLFPNSSDFPRKRPLSDVRLCGWWKKLLTGVAKELDERSKVKPTIRLYYILPGYSELEAINSLRVPFPSTSSLSPAVSWTYGHPYSQTDVRLPCPPPPTEKSNLGHFIPYFDDCPKSRFLDEIAHTTEANGVKSPARKRSRTNTLGDSINSHEVEPPKKEERPLGQLENVSSDEFWERMSFRQECVAGAVTGFFTLGLTATFHRSSRSPLEPQPGQVSAQLIKRVLQTMHTGVEFPTVDLAIRATETLEGAVRGLCDGIASIHTPIIQAPRPVRPVSKRGSKLDIPRPKTPEPQMLAPPPPRTPPPRGNKFIADISPNPFPEPETSLETYNSHIYGSVCVSNAELPPKDASSTEEGGGDVSRAPQVTVLTVRKKKKRPE